ncbi:hypothetical protein [Streptomyces sp. NPDC093544]|uniref:AraC-like ligand-binding domain-containing protein n=1 Tax=Streptomyces sp. NPDC093544 TaxID=3155200 RepID=UPI00343FE6BD
MGRTHAPMQLSSDRAANYRGRQRLIELADVTVWPATFDSLVFRRTQRLIRQSDPEVYHLSFLVQGNGSATRGRQEIAYRTSDIHISSSSRPFEISAGPEPVTIIGAPPAAAHRTSTSTTHAAVSASTASCGGRTPPEPRRPPTAGRTSRTPAGASTPRACPIGGVRAGCGRSPNGRPTARHWTGTGNAIPQRVLFSVPLSSIDSSLS